MFFFGNWPRAEAPRRCLYSLCLSAGTRSCGAGVKSAPHGSPGDSVFEAFLDRAFSAFILFLYFFSFFFFLHFHRPRLASRPLAASGGVGSIPLSYSRAGLIATILFSSGSAVQTPTGSGGRAGPGAKCLRRRSIPSSPTFPPALAFKFHWLLARDDMLFSFFSSLFFSNAYSI